MKTTRVTTAQALVRHLSVQHTEIAGKRVPLFAGMWAIFGHGNVAGIGEALAGVRTELPTFRAHNEQAMAHAAIAFAKASRRRRMMACTTSIGPGATNMVTAAAVAHVNRLPVLLLPGDVYASRRPDPVLQQIEDFGDGTISANDCFRPVSRYFDRITRPEQIVPALARAMQVLTDPADCGPVTLALCQDVQAEAFDCPLSFLAPRLWRPRRPWNDSDEQLEAIAAISAARKPLIIAGGGVIYAEAEAALAEFAGKHGIPVAVTQAGKGAMSNVDPLCVGGIGVTGTSAANALARESDLIIAIGTRLQDFTTGSWSLFANEDCRIVGFNVQPFDAFKHRAIPFIADARAGLQDIMNEIEDNEARPEWTDKARRLKAEWQETARRYTDATETELPTDAQVIGAVQRAGAAGDIVVSAAGGLPGELHKLWHVREPGTYHVEYGYSCMGYEIAGGLGVKMARPEAEVIVMVGDGSYLMMNSEIATSVMLGLKLIIVVLDNRGFGCITRLQVACGAEPFNNLLADTTRAALPEIDFAAHAKSLGAHAVKVTSLAELEAAVGRARSHDRTSVIVIDTDPLRSTGEGGHWWDVAVAEVSDRAEVRAARAAYEAARKGQRVGD